MKYLSCKGFVCLAAVLAVVAIWPAQSYAADPYTYNIISVTNTARGNFPTVTFSVTNTTTNQLANLRLDPGWTQTGARLVVHFGWDTRDFNNTDSNTNLPNPASATGAPYAKGAAYPIPVNALGANVIDHGDNTYSATAPLPIPVTATGTGRAIMEGHPALKDAAGLFIPVKSVYKSFGITDTSIVERRSVVDIQTKCMVCHRTDGTGVAPRLTLHGENRTEEIQVCVVCHNPNQTDVQRRMASDATNYPVKIGPYTFNEQSVDFKRLVHGIHASSAGFRKNPLVVMGPILPTGRFIFDASKLKPFPASLRNCLNCHIDNGTKGTFELPLAPNVLASTLKTQSSFGATVPETVVDANPANDENVTPIAAVCSSCHDGNEAISHMVNTGGASFRTTQAAIGVTVNERCPSCHGPGKEKSVRRVHLSSDDD